MHIVFLLMKGYRNITNNIVYCIVHGDLSWAHGDSP